MKFSAKSDIDAPIEQVFAVVSDFDLVERAASRRGVEVQRTSDVPPPAPGMAWTAGFTFRGKPRQADVTLTECKIPEALVFDTESSGLQTQVRIELTALSRGRTRMHLKADMTPKTLAARLLVQSLKLAKANLDKRFSARVADVARAVETRAKTTS